MNTETVRNELSALIRGTSFENRSGKLLYSGLETVQPGALYLVGLNPSGFPDQEPQTVREHLASATDRQNEYLDTIWHWGGYASPAGTDRRQQRVQLLASELGFDLRTVLATNCFFVRERHPERLLSGAGFSQLAAECWTVHEYLLSRVKPSLVVCFGEKALRFFRERMARFGPSVRVVGVRHFSAGGSNAALMEQYRSLRDFL